MKKPYNKRHGKYKRYTVYDNKTDLPVAICCSTAQCCRAMGVKLATFYNLISNKKRKDNGNRWTIIREYLEEYELDGGNRYNI